MEQIQNTPDENLPGNIPEDIEAAPEQIIEGVIGESPENWNKFLPAGITSEMTDLFLGSDHLWHWHLKPDYIKDEKQRKHYKEEREMWP